MYPVLFRIGGLEVESFWVTVLVGFLVALFVARAELRRTGHDPDLAYDLILSSYVGGFVGARVFLVFSAWDAFARDPFEFLFSGSGWVWQGGVLGGAVAVIYAAKRRGLPLGDVFDLSGPCLSVGQAIGRIGCQLSGDGDYGIATTMPWGMSYPNGVVPTQETVHPTPIYESAAYFLIFVYLWSRRWRPHIPGSPLGAYLIYTGIVRFAVEFVRRNPVVALGLTLPQFASIASVAIGAALLARIHSTGTEWKAPEPVPNS
jgi:phosphatidylglycerol:prolipoprotein diacylglycerol transferase